MSFLWFAVIGVVAGWLAGQIMKGAGFGHCVRARAGQTMSIDLDSNNGALNFNIFEPGMKPGEDRAMFIGSTEGARFEGVLPGDGDYILTTMLRPIAALPGVWAGGPFRRRRGHTT